MIKTKAKRKQKKINDKRRSLRARIYILETYVTMFVSRTKLILTVSDSSLTTPTQGVPSGSTVSDTVTLAGGGSTVPNTAAGGESIVPTTITGNYSKH